MTFSIMITVGNVAANQAIIESRAIGLDAFGQPRQNVQIEMNIWDKDDVKRLIVHLEVQLHYD